MTEPSDTLPPLPAFVRRRDGRLVPFDPDRICRSLFEAAVRLGRPDAFLARELTDGLLHFLAADAEGIPTTEQIRELAVKVVRELGQPALAAALADDVSVAWTTAAPLFGPDLVAAHHDGLLRLDGLDTPLELAACILKPPARLAALRQVCAGIAVVDGPEHTLAREDGSAAEFAAQLGEELQSTGLRAVVNLNSTPPPWADDLADGPLFAALRDGPESGRLAGLADDLLDALAGCGVRIDWHLAAGDLEPASETRLRGVAVRALAGKTVAFVFDRPRRSVPLAEGVDRRHPAVLLTVGLNLPRLAEQVLPGVRSGSADEIVQRFLSKLASLARMALSAGLQKRDFLRRQASDRPGLTRGFLLDRARLVATPIGLEELTRSLTGRGLCGSAAALDLGRRIVGRLREVLRVEGRAARLETCLDGASVGAGLSAWDATAAPEQQLRVASQLQAGGETGTAVVCLSPTTSPEEVVALLRAAWERTDIVRLLLVTEVGVTI